MGGAAMMRVARRHRDAPGRPQVQPPPLLTLSLVGLALELVLLLGFLRPLALWRYPRVMTDARPLVTVFGADLAGVLRFAVPVACAFAAFAIALWLAPGVAGRAARGVVLGGTALFSFTLVLMHPVGAHDVYHNVADARTLWRYGANPTVAPPADYPNDPFYPHVAAWEDYPSVYGPAWYLIAGAPLPLTGDGLWPNVIGQKLLAALFLLGTTVLAMGIAAQLRPGTAAAAGVLVGWNPLLQYETAANAHNGVVMMCFVLAALYAITRRWWVAVFPLLALSVATKYVMGVLGPLLLVWLLRRREVPRGQLLLSLALGALLGTALEAWFFAGTDTLLRFRREAGFVDYSPTAVLHVLLERWLPLEDEQTLVMVQLLLLPPYLVAYARLLWRLQQPCGPSVRLSS